MKRILITIGLVCGFMVSSGWGKAPWAEDKYAANQRHGLAPLGDIAQEDNPELMHSVLPYVLTKKPVRVEVDISRLGSEHAKQQKYFEQKVSDIYREWFFETLLALQEREEEFADVLPVLSGGIKLQFIRPQETTDYRNSEVSVVIFPTLASYQKELEQDEDSLGLFRPGGVYSPMDIFIHLEDEGTWIHEIGHSFGFADEYQEGYDKNASAMYQSKKRATDSVMLDKDTSDETSVSGVTCADAEGFVNLLDLWTIRLAKHYYSDNWPKHVSKRITGGWESLECGLDDFYLLGSSVHVLFEHRSELSPAEQRLLEKAFLEKSGDMGKLSADEKDFLRQLRQRNVQQQLKQGAAKTQK